MATVTLPWPASILSPNGRSHWAPKAKAVKAARTDAFYLTRAAVTIKPTWERVALSVTFCPPDRRHYDRDNLVGRLKAATDGIADALGIDDRFFEPTYRIAEPVKGGAVHIEILPLQ